MMTRFSLILILAGCVTPGPDDCQSSAVGLNRYCGERDRVERERPEEPEREEEEREPEKEREREPE